MADTRLHLEVVTPTSKKIDQPVDEVVIPGHLGELGILAGHRPLLTLLKIGIMRFRDGSTWHDFAVNQGYAEVFGNQVAVVTDTCERATEIDLQRAREARQRASERLEKIESINADFLRAENALHRAETRIDVASESGKKE